MEHGACNVIYIDRRANDEHVRKENLSKSLVARTSTATMGQSYFALGKTSPREVHNNVEALLTMCSEGKKRAFGTQSHGLRIAQYTYAALADLAYRA